jgi:lysyl-tRNA synthetase class 2
MVEWYEAYADYTDMMARVEQVVAKVARVCDYDGDLDFSPPWRRVTLREAIAEHTGGLDILEHTDRDSLGAAIRAAGLQGYDLGDRTWPQLVDDLVSREVEPNVTDPVFVTDYPKELSPFAKDHRDGGGLVERFEAFCSGMEIANAFTELNDPDEQRYRFEQQARLEAEGDDEAQPYDEVFVQALEQGMPPTGGVGMGIDRLVMLMTGRRSIREIVLFPAMRD